MILFGLAELELQELVDLYLSREDAEQALRNVLRDEPDCAGFVDVIELELDFSLN